MHPFAAGAALLDPTGALLAADRGFRALLGLGGADAGAALRARAAAEPALGALVRGEGPAEIAVAGAGGTPLDLERVPAGAGVLVVARAAGLGEALEHAMRSVALGRAAGGVVHDARNPLNTLALQLALVEGRLAPWPEARAAAEGNLDRLREQVGRVDALLRRLVDVADPPDADVSALLARVEAALGYEGRRRGIDVAVEAAAGLRTPGEPARVGRLVLALFARALAGTPDHGRLAARAEARGASIAVTFAHGQGAEDPALGPWLEVAAAGAVCLGGALAEERREGTVRLTLTLPGGGGR